MSRIVNVLFALVLLIALVIALDPQARTKAVETVQSWQPTLKQLDSRVVVNVPTVSTPGISKTPLPTATSVANADDAQIPVTGDSDTSTEPIIQINWNALGNALRQFWVSLSQVKINFNTPKDNK